MILERLKEYIDSKGISVSAFEKSIGMSNASFGKSLKNKGAIGTDKLENILTVYPDLSPDWLLTGRGEMLKSKHTFPENHTSCPNPELGNTISKDSDNNPIPQANSNFSADTILRLIADKDETIRYMAEEIGRLKERIAMLECRLQKDASSADTHHTANVG